MATLREVTLYKTEGSADKVYGLSIETTDDLLLVKLFYMNGPRGGALRKNLKLATPVSLEVANKEFDKVQRAKMKDGYTPAESGIAYTSSEDAGRVSGYRPMLPADLPKNNAAGILQQLLDSSEWGMQEKKDGENRPLIIQDGQVQGANKNGLIVNIPAEWQAASVLGDIVIYGEHMADSTFHAFDLHAPALSFALRYNKLVELLQSAPQLSFIKLVKVVVGAEEKRAYLRALDAAKLEGVVFKKLSANFEEGKSDNSYRYKLWESMTCMVTNVNAQRSVAIAAMNPATGVPVPLGNVTVPANQSVPTISSLIEVRYLYWNEGGSLIQPTLIGKRTDVALDTVTTAQITRIKLKGAPIDLDDETLSEQSLAELARSEFQENLASLQFFMPKGQIEAVKELSRGEEGQFYMEKIQELAHRVRNMPKTRETDGLGDSALIHLRYTRSNGDVFLVTEKDVGAAGDKLPGQQLQAFGVSGDAQSVAPAYISIADLIDHGVELDFYFEPQTIEAYEQAHQQQEQECA